MNDTQAEAARVSEAGGLDTFPKLLGDLARRSPDRPAIREIPGRRPGISQYPGGQEEQDYRELSLIPEMGGTLFNRVHGARQIGRCAVVRPGA